MNIKMVVAYDGTGYCGFQRQRPEAGASVQGCLEEAIGRVVGAAVNVTAAGRTDAGVHAEGQVINIRSETSVPVDRLPYAVNRYLPPEIVIIGAQEVDDRFHARFSAVGKAYRYTVWRDTFPSPFLRRFTWHRPGPLDVEAMRAAVSCLTGRRDFASFQAAGRPVRDTRREVREFTVEEEEPFLRFRVVADGFLYKMVRSMVGTIMEVGRGRMTPDDMPAVLAARDRRRAGPTAPPTGLCLEEVYYG